MTNFKYVIRSISRIGSDQLWSGVILAGFLFYVSLIPLPPNDFWWHLKIGELIYIEKSIPTTNMFAWTIPGDSPFFYAAWLGELLFYLLYRLGTLEIIMFTRTLLAGITFVLVGYLSKEKSGSWRIAAITTALACVMSMNNLPVRTQIWAWLPFVLVLLILVKYTEKQPDVKLLIALPIIMIFWVNTHGTFILGYILMVIFILGAISGKLLHHNGSLAWKEICQLILLVFASVITIFINPRGSEIISYVSSILTNQPIQSYIEEWLPPTPRGIANITFFLSILGFLVIFAYSTYKPSITEILLIITFTWLAFNGQRSVIWYSIATAPILARGITGLPIKLPQLQTQKSFINLLLIIVLFIPVLLVQPWFIRKFPLPKTYMNQVILDSSDGPLLSKHTPTEALEYLRDHPGGNFFTEMGYASYIIWKLPDLGVFVDPRIELFPYELWQDYIHISRGTIYSELLDGYHVDRVILDKEIQPDLSKSLNNDPKWLLEFEDDISQVWKRNVDD